MRALQQGIARHRAQRVDRGIGFWHVVLGNSRRSRSRAHAMRGHPAAFRQRGNAMAQCRRCAGRGRIAARSRECLLRNVQGACSHSIAIHARMNASVGDVLAMQCAATPRRNAACGRAARCLRRLPAQRRVTSRARALYAAVQQTWVCTGEWLERFACLRHRHDRSRARVGRAHGTHLRGPAPASVTRQRAHDHRGCAGGGGPGRARRACALCTADGAWIA